MHQGVQSDATYVTSNNVAFVCTELETKKIKSTYLSFCFVLEYADDLSSVWN